MTTLLIDGDILVYDVTYQHEEPTHFGGDLWLWWGNADQAKEGIKAEVGRLLAATSCNEFRIAFSCPSHRYFRHDIFPAYKASRVKSRKPVLFPELRRFCVEDWGCAAWEPNLEADDLLGVWSGGDSIVCSIDKDMLTLVGRHYNPVKETMVEMTKAEADRNFYRQALMGDSTDGYPGCPGIGPKTADKLLDAADEPWPAILEAFESHGLTEHDALTQARMARILRPGEYDFRTREVHLWNPPVEVVA